MRNSCCSGESCCHLPHTQGWSLDCCSARQDRLVSQQPSVTDTGVRCDSSASSAGPRLKRWADAVPATRCHLGHGSLHPWASVWCHLQVYALSPVLLTILTYLLLLVKAHNFHGFQGLLEHLVILLRRNGHVAMR